MSHITLFAKEVLRLTEDLERMSKYLGLIQSEALRYKDAGDETKELARWVWLRASSGLGTMDSRAWPARKDKPTP